MNSKRGEITLNIKGEEYTIAPTFKAISLLRDMTGGKPLLAVINEVQQVDPVLCAQILYAALRGNGYTDFKLDEIGELLLIEDPAEGIENGFENAIVFLTNVIVQLSGGSKKKTTEKPKKEQKMN